ncbi:MAG: lipopolysaccharide kinase InaA family protein [Syntrophotaleaceae bacterium]
MSQFVEMGDILVASEFWPVLQKAGLTSFEAFMDFSGGQRIVHKRGRSVFRFEIGERAFYLKRNFVHPVELWKKLSRGKLPPRGALEEWKNILAVASAGVPTVRPVVFGERTFLGMERISFTVTEELYGARPLDEIVRDRFRNSGQFMEKRTLIAKMAELARCLHHAGMNHQDFYLNHFFLGQGGELYLLDLQRVQRRSRVPGRYKVKDLGQLNYSALYYGGFTRTDRLRFLLRYLDRKFLSREDKRLARQIIDKTARIARHDVKLTARRRKRGELPPAAQ